MAEIQRAMNLATEFVSGGKVIVDGLDGPVVVEGWDRNEVSLAATKHASAGSEEDAERLLADMETAFRRSGSELTISVTGNGHRRRGSDAWIDCYIRVPAASDLYVDTSSGSVDIRGVSGRIRLDTGSGSATLRQCGGEIVVDTGSGAVAADDISGDLNIDVGSGAVTVVGISGELFVDAGSGSVNARRVGGKVTIDSAGPVTTSETGGDLVIDATGAVRATAAGGGFAHIDTTGSVEAEFAVAAGGRYTVEAGGEARISVPSAARLEIKGEAQGLKYDLPLTIQRMDDGEFDAILNGRGARLNVDIAGRLTMLPSDLPPAESVSAVEPVAESGSTAVGAEYRTIIQMVADGKITPEEADALLAAINQTPGQAE